eukprot:5857356-Amphidinium_carterae.1
MQWRRPLDRPWVLRADFNVTPDILQDYRIAWPSPPLCLRGGSSAPRPVCKMGGRAAASCTCVNCFLASHCLARKLGPVTIAEHVTTRPHWGIHMIFSAI